MTNYAALRRQFEKIGCDPDKPGFCNDPAFLAAEQTSPTLLEDYARLVQLRPVEDFDLVVRRVTHAADYLHAAVARAGRLGACVDASCVLAEMLTRRGVWCFVVKGGASVFPADKSAGVKPVRMQPVCGAQNPAVAGHAWVVAPPFRIVDVTIGLQPYRGTMQRLVPRDEIVAVADPRSGQPTIEDFIDDDAMRAIGAQFGRRPTLEDLFTRIDPGLDARVAEFGVHEVEVGRVVVRYVPCAVAGMAEPVEEWRNLELDGLWPAEFCDGYVARVDLP